MDGTGSSSPLPPETTEVLMVMTTFKEE